MCGTLLLLCLLCLAGRVGPLTTLTLLRRELSLLVARLLQIIVRFLPTCHASYLVLAHGPKDGWLSRIRSGSLRPTLLRNLTTLLGTQMAHPVFTAIGARSGVQASLARLLSVDLPRGRPVYDHACLLQTPLQLLSHLESA